MKTYYLQFELAVIMLISMTLWCCTPKDTDWEFAGSRRVRFEVLRPNCDESLFPEFKASDVYSINVDIYTRYQDGKRIYGVRNDEGNIYPDDNAGHEALSKELRINNFRYSDVIGTIREEYQNLP